MSKDNNGGWREEIIFLGAILGIIVSLITIYDRILVSESEHTHQVIAFIVLGITIFVIYNRFLSMQTIQVKKTQDERQIRVQRQTQKAVEPKENKIQQVKQTQKVVEPKENKIQQVRKTLTATVPKNMVFIKGGTFQMGDEHGDLWEGCRPVHTVTLSSFYIGKYEVTQKEWYDVMGNNPSDFKGCDQCPVENVSWKEVQQFIQKRNQQMGYAEGTGYRLPTEAEWEYAARGGQNYKYAGSDAINEVAWYWGNADEKTHPVGLKKENGYGLYDMSGNVWEWCNDWYASYSNGPSTNPRGPSNGSRRVIRGGGWDISARYCRVANRSSNYPTNRASYIGFRLVFVP